MCEATLPALSASHDPFSEPTSAIRRHFGNSIRFRDDHLRDRFGALVQGVLSSTIGAQVQTTEMLSQRNG